MQHWTLWKPRALKHCTTLEQQIEFLSDKFYAGCGFHYARLPDLVETKRQIHALGPGPDTWWKHIVARVRLGFLTKELKAAIEDVERRTHEQDR